MRVLFTSAGRRVELIQFFRDVPGVELVVAADIGPTAPSLYLADAGVVMLKEGEAGYSERLLAICRHFGIDLLIPLLDPELPYLAGLREDFRAQGVTVLVSPPAAIELCADKLKTAQFFTALGIPAPATYSLAGFLASGHDAGEWIVKPRRGSAGKGVHRCAGKAEVAALAQGNGECVVQEFARGYEVTLDVLCDLESQVLAAIPRKRLKVRAGEAERAVTIEAPELTAQAARIAAALPAVGPINVQCFVTDQGPLFTEVNPRFGGGYPLAHHAGADFPRLIADLVRGRRVEPRIGAYQRNLCLMRYDAAVYRREEDLLDPAGGL